MKVWISRNKEIFSDRICIYFEKPHSAKAMFVGIKDNFPICEIHNNEFEKLFNFIPKKNSCKQYNIELKKVKE